MGNFEQFEHEGRMYVSETHTPLSGMVLTGRIMKYHPDFTGIMTDAKLVKDILSGTTSRDGNNKLQHDLGTTKGINKHFQGCKAVDIINLTLKVCQVNGFFEAEDTSTEEPPKAEDAPTEEP